MKVKTIKKKKGDVRGGWWEGPRIKEKKGNKLSRTGSDKERVEGGSERSAGETWGRREDDGGERWKEGMEGGVEGRGPSSRWR